MSQTVRRDYLVSIKNLPADIDDRQVALLIQAAITGVAIPKREDFGCVMNDEDCECRKKWLANLSGLKLSVREVEDYYGDDEDEDE